MNRYLFTARLTRDPEVRYTAGDKNMCIARFGIAVPRRGSRDQEKQADFFNCVCFGKLAETAEKYLKKGMKIAGCGRLENDSWTNREGQQVTSIQIVIDEFEFCESRASQGDSSASAGKVTGKSGDGFMAIPDGIEEELPY